MKNNQAQTAKVILARKPDSETAAKIEAFAKGKRVFIVGSGLVGLDAASALCERGAEVTIAEMAQRVMPLQTDDYAAGVYQQAFEAHGCRFLLGLFPGFRLRALFLQNRSGCFGRHCGNRRSRNVIGFRGRRQGVCHQRLPLRRRGSHRC